MEEPCRYPHELMRCRSATLWRIRRERVEALEYIKLTFDSEREFLALASECIERVVLVLGSPRGGTSALKAQLALCGNVQAWPGEHRFLFTLLGLNYPDHGLETESVNAGGLDSDGETFFMDNLYFECGGRPHALETRQDAELFAWKWALRFRLQWPDLDVALEWLVRKVVDVVEAQWAAGMTVSGTETTLRTLTELRACSLPVEPWYYDLPESLLAERFGEPRPVAWQSAAPIIEITPFIVLEPLRRRLPSPSQVLLLKASSDAYRTNLLRWLLRKKQLGFVHLTRNPAAAINGLLDGWEHRCFWQHDLRQLGAPPSAKSLWCFDLFDGWQSSLDRSLVDICAKQWAEPHQRIQRDLADVEVTSARFEDFVRGDGSRAALVGSLLARLKVEQKASAAVPPPIVNQTAKPTNRRWERVRPWLYERCLRPDLVDVTRALGYDPAARAEWL